MDTRRLILFVIFSMSILMLWDAWQRQHAPAEPVPHTSTTTGTAASTDHSVPSQNVDTNTTKAELPADTDYKLLSGQRITVTTDLYKADIETTGGDLRRLELLKHRAADSDKSNFVLMDDAAKPMTLSLIHI